MNSRNKGKRGELELAKKLREYGYNCRRTQQFCGINGDADVIGLPGLYIECKRVEKLNLYEAMAQAKRDAKPGEKPVVFWRRNNHKWLMVFEIDDGMEVYQEWEAGHDLQEDL